MPRGKENVMASRKSERETNKEIKRQTGAQATKEEIRRIRRNARRAWEANRQIKKLTGRQMTKKEAAEITNRRLRKKTGKQVKKR